MRCQDIRSECARNTAAIDGTPSKQTESCTANENPVGNRPEKSSIQLMSAGDCSYGASLVNSRCGSISCVAARAISRRAQLQSCGTVKLRFLRRSGDYQERFQRSDDAVTSTTRGCASSPVRVSQVRRRSVSEDEAGEPLGATVTALCEYQATLQRFLKIYLRSNQPSRVSTRFLPSE